MRQNLSSLGLGHLRPLWALTSPGRGDNDKPGLREALCGLIPGWREAKHTYGYAYGTESGATRRPRVPFPKSTSRKPSNPGGLKRKGGPKHKVEIGDQVEVTAFRA